MLTPSKEHNVLCVETLHETPNDLIQGEDKVQTTMGNQCGKVTNGSWVRAPPGPPWGISSVGRATALHAVGHRFDPVILHHIIY